MDIPSEVIAVINSLRRAGFQAYAVGGCARDLIRGVSPKDWDVTTDALPDAVQRLFPDSVYENAFGTVGVKTRSDNPTLALVEVTTFRTESGYADMRHPDAVAFTTTLEDDLARRDFTMNAIALAPRADASGAYEIVDPYGGQKDIAACVIRAVGDPAARFSEDALRMLRAVRFAAELGFHIEEETAAALRAASANLAAVSRERIRDELEQLVMSKDAAGGVQLLEHLGLLAHILPELREGIGVEQNHHHIYSVWEHNLRALAYTAGKGYPLAVRLAALLHDVGKPRTKRGEGRACTFHGHEVVGARMAREMLSRLRFPKALIEDVEALVRHHLFYYVVDEVTEASVRRLLKNLGPERIDDLVRVREADRIGSGVPKAVPYKLRHFRYMVEKVSKDPIATSMLALDGTDVMRILEIPPGPKVGLVLNALLGEVLDDPAKNTEEYLEPRIREFGEKTAEDLQAFLDMKQKKIDAEEAATRKKFAV